VALDMHVWPASVRPLRTTINAAETATASAVRILNFQA
jgi:hypothetical protein